MAANNINDPHRENSYETHVLPFLFSLDAETAHNLIHSTVPLLRPFTRLLEGTYRFEDPALNTSFVGKTFSNPVGLAAGFDKNAHLGSLLDALGVGFAEIGSVTHRASRGNPKPRLFRLPEDEAVINRLGLNGDGAAVVSSRLKRLKCRTPLAVNIAKTNDPTIVGDLAVRDLLASFLAVRDLPLPYLTVNASCPNTHDGITREMGELEAAISEMQSNNSRAIPLFIKLSPDSSDSLLSSILEIGRRHKVAGYVCGNTSVSRLGLSTETAAVQEIGNGGLSGKPLLPLSMSLCKRVMKMKETGQYVIACGGIASGDDVFRFLQAGASAVQIYTALVYKGPGLIQSIKKELSAILLDHGTSVSDVVAASRSQPIGL